MAYDYGRNLLRALPPRAVLFDPDDPTSFTVRALQVTEYRRTDVWPLNFFRTRWGYEELRRRTDLLPPDPIENGQQLERALWTYAARRRPFYGELPQKLEGHPYAAEGLIYAANVADSAATRQLAEQNLLRVMRHDAAPATAYDDFFARHLVSYYAAAHCNLGLAYANARQPEPAIFHYKMALALDPTMAVAYNNWGTALYLQKRYAEAARLYRAGLAAAPNDAGLTANLRYAVAAQERMR